MMGRSNVVDPAEWPKIVFTKPGFWEHVVGSFLEKSRNTKS